MSGFTAPGDFPVFPQAPKNRGTTRMSHGVKQTRTYGVRQCACGAPLSRYNPDDECRICQVRRRKRA